MDTAQIYLIPNWDTQDENEWTNVTNHIGMSSPYHTKDEQGALSGVDSMVRVIQHLLRTFHLELAQRLIREHRGDNFLVDLAIRNFERDTPWQRQNMQVARDVVWRGLCRQKLGTSGAPSFFEIDQSPLVQETLWAEPSFQPFHKSLVQPRGAQGFQALGTLDEYPSDLDVLRTSRSLFVFDTSVHGSIEDMFKKHFQRIHFDGSHGTYTLFSKGPKLARVLFNPTKAKLEGLSMSDMNSMAMATRRVTRQRSDGGKSGPTVTYSAENMVVTYGLAAVVRLRNSPQEHDYVRLYDRYGNPVVPTGPAEDCTSYHSSDWCVSDQDHQYMLYYVSVGIDDRADPGRQVAEHEQAEPQPASSGTQSGSSQRPVSIILAGRTGPPSSATMPSSSVHHPASAADPTGQASSAVQEKSSAPPVDSASPSLHRTAEEAAEGQHGSPNVQEVPGEGEITGTGADDDDDDDDDDGDGGGDAAAAAPRRASKSQTPGGEPKKASVSASTRRKKRKRDPLPTYSSSFEEQERENARQSGQGD